MKRSNKNMLRAVSLVLCGAMCASTASVLTGCNIGEKDSIVLMTDELSGLFNPFYATSGSDMDVVGLTQISMLTTDSTGTTVAGDEYATVVKDFDYKVQTSGSNTETVYTFVIKNGLMFSDGVHPLTMNDVMFNIYEYLDPVYTGSSTMYSIDIKGLSQYRTQTNYSNNDDTETQISEQAAGLATLRILELVDVFETNGKISSSSSSYSLSESDMKEAISNWSVSSGYISAVATDKQQTTWTDTDYRTQLLQDYQLALDTFKEELSEDFISAKESYDTTTAPYSDWATELESDLFKFFLYEGYITPEYKDNQGKKDLTKIVKFNGTEILNSFTSADADVNKAAAINRVYNDTVKSDFNKIITQWGTAGTLSTQFTADAKEIILRNSIYNSTGDEDSLIYKNIEGIVSLGHTTKTASVTVNGTTYAVAQEHNEDGTPKNSNEYDVLQITVNGTDPKAIYNFGFTVAPAYYYTADEEYPDGREIDIENNKFGVEYSSTDFQTKVIKSSEHVSVPVGAGSYKATDLNDSDNPTGSAFWNSNMVYYKKNENFMFEVKADKLRLKVVSSSDALDSLENGEVDYVTPQFTLANSQRVTKMVNTGKFSSLSSWQLGYGYIGINAGKVPNINIRKAIMCAMETSLATQYYDTGTCTTIDWPMSSRSWAYPWADDSKTTEKDNNSDGTHDYLNYTNESSAKTKIQKYMNLAGVSAGDSSLSITFTIAGSSISDHPTYNVFRQAQQILNDMGWDIELKADSRALTKLSTGSLEVWAAAWGSTVDPDMYQVYHKNSTATSVYAWGYREIKADTTTYSVEWNIIKQLSTIIEEARSYMDQATRKPLYEQAMSLVLDLAVEMPVYQRMNLYAYNSSTVTGFPTTVNEYSSPLEKVWELELVK